MSDVPTPHGPARVVLITGVPGSGKTTLGAELSRALRVPFIARDDIRGGLLLTAGAWGGRLRAIPTSDDAVEAFIRIVETTAGLGVSCVVEYVVRRHRPQDLDRITAVADCVVLVTSCHDPLDRFAARANAELVLNQPALLDALGYATVDQHTHDARERMQAVTREMRTEFDLPVLEVRTDDGFDPDLERIIDFATETRTTDRS